MPTFDIEVKWNNAAVKSTCPITGDVHKPWIGMYPFQAGTYNPILFEAIEDSDPQAAHDISAINAGTSHCDCKEPSPVAMQITIKDCWIQAR